MNQQNLRNRNHHNIRSYCAMQNMPCKKKHVHCRIITRAMTTASGCFAIPPVAGREATEEPMKLNGRGAKHVQFLPLESTVQCCFRLPRKGKAKKHTHWFPQKCDIHQSMFHLSAVLIDEWSTATYHEKVNQWGDHREQRLKMNSCSLPNSEVIPSFTQTAQIQTISSKRRFLDLFFLETLPNPVLNQYSNSNEALSPLKPPP